MEIAQPAQGDSPEGEEPTPMMMTLSERGPRLPMGTTLSGDEYAQELKTRPWRTKEERKLAEVRERMRSGRFTDYVTHVLAFMYAHIGHHDFDKVTSEPQRLLALQKMVMGDVIYAYVWLRRQALGPILKIDIECPKCGNEIGFRADLDTLDIRCAERIEDTFWTYDLVEPFKIRDKIVERFTFGAARWSSLVKVSGPLTAASGKLALLEGSVYAINDEKTTRFRSQDLDDLSKRDLEAILEEYDQHHMGPDLSIEEECPQCLRTFRTSIDWGYDSFFAGSSR